MTRRKVAEYRRHAEECLRLAEIMTMPEHRAVLVSMARAWHQLAQSHEATRERDGLLSSAP